MTTNSYSNHAVFVRQNLTDIAKEQITKALMSKIKDTCDIDAIHTLFKYRSELSFGYPSVSADDAPITINKSVVHPTVKALKVGTITEKQSHRIKEDTKLLNALMLNNDRREYFKLAQRFTELSMDPKPNADSIVELSEVIKRMDVLGEKLING